MSMIEAGLQWIEVYRFEQVNELLYTRVPYSYVACRV